MRSMLFRSSALLVAAVVLCAVDAPAVQAEESPPRAQEVAVPCGGTDLALAVSDVPSVDSMFVVQQEQAIVTASRFIEVAPVTHVRVRTIPASRFADTAARPPNARDSLTVTGRTG